MHKKLIVFICILFLAGSLPVCSKAQNPTTPDYNLESIRSITYLKNGDCLVEFMPKIVTEQRDSVIGQKSYYYKNSDGVIRWTATLTGTFTYNGSTATCTAASCETSVQSGNWSETYNHAYPSGNKAQADVTMVRKVLFITVQTETAHLILTCNGNGNLS